MWGDRQGAINVFILQGTLYGQRFCGQDNKSGLLMSLVTF